MPKLIHRAKYVNPNGGVSALCFEKPRSIDLGRASWTNRDEAVTCKKCLEHQSVTHHKQEQERGR